MVLADPEQPENEADSNRIIAIADELRSEFDDSIYARFAALFAAQQAVAQNDLQRAESDLQWILDNPQQ